MKKIKIAYLLLGIGVGIILVSSLYSIFPKIKYVDLSDEIIIERAKELGYISLKESIKKEKKDESKEKIQVKPKEIDKEEQVKFEIQEGDNLADIAEKLFNLKLIDNKKDFISLAEDKMVDKKFAFGVFDIKYNTSYETIIDLLIR